MDGRAQPPYRFRWSTGDATEMRTSAKELVELKPDLIVGMTTPAVAALVQETKTIPIVFASIVDPVGRGFISNLARPGGNVTGILNFEFSMGGKWLETLKHVAPRSCCTRSVSAPATRVPSDKVTPTGSDEFPCRFNEIG